ncbi:helix-turn-helix transcriptional regulator [Shewanella atlantica]|uniref:LuxR family transcriptional regulator n=1 Tax=Shewanella atlantica TaxID=271099 RepID=A0A3S0RPX0_9GAMM|nr:LuxR family transcriptional regulator [Shewanella atlantica]RTR33593.1 LuxR family transcriptional regulator [Shewanella atlantica]
MSNTKTKHCNIDSIYVSQANEVLSKYGITNFFYGITTKEKGASLYQFKRLRSRIPGEMCKANKLIFSRDSIRLLLQYYIEHFASRDGAYSDRVHLGPNVPYSPDYSGGKGEQFKRLMDKHGAVSRAIWLLPVKYNSDWRSAFVLFSDQSRKTLLSTFTDNRQEIERQLQLYATLFNDQCISQLNPISNFNCLSAKTMQVLQLTAQGYSSDEIGEKLTISESGVNYHQNRLKELFNAKNRAQLVSSAHTLGVLE